MCYSNRTELAPSCFLLFFVPTTQSHCTEEKSDSFVWIFSFTCCSFKGSAFLDSHLPGTLHFDLFIVIFLKIKQSSFCIVTTSYVVLRFVCFLLFLLFRICRLHWRGKRNSKFHEESKIKNETYQKQSICFTTMRRLSVGFLILNLSPFSFSTF